MTNQLRPVRVRLEQMRQARRIHGGTLGLLGAALGVRLARTPIPGRALRRKVFRMLYGAKYESLDERELEKPLAEYRTVNELFTRGVPEGLRTLPERTDQFLSPVDSTVQEAGRITDDLVLRVKGLRYSLQSLLPDFDTAPFSNGHFAVLFLSPRDCHRVYSPADGRILSLTHVPGHRLLVHPTHQTQEFPVFTLNERLIISLDTDLGRCVLVMVAGWGVGNITHPFPVSSRISPRRVTTRTLDPPRAVRRGEWIATFELGSTVICLLETSGAGGLCVGADDTLRIGEPLFHAAEDSDPQDVEV